VRVFRIIFDASDYLSFCIANGYATLHERRDLLSRQFFQGVLNKSSCLNYLLPELRSDTVTDKLRHPSVFKLPRVRAQHVLSHLLILLTMLLTIMPDVIV